MINSFCISTPVPVSDKAQAHLDTRCPVIKDTYCHGNSCARRSNHFDIELNSVRAKNLTKCSTRRSGYTPAFVKLFSVGHLSVLRPIGLALRAAKPPPRRL